MRLRLRPAHRVWDGAQGRVSRPPAGAPGHLVDTRYHPPSALVNLADEIGVEGIAELVQDEETMGFPAESGVESARSYYPGKPAEFAEP